LTEAADQNGIVLANLPAGPTERRIAFAVGLAILVIAGVVAPFASVQLPENAAWIPITSREPPVPMALHEPPWQ
jgi:hypothetical protein